MVGPQPDPKALEHAFRLEVFKMLKKESKISDAVIDNMLSWLGSRFNIFCSRPTDPKDQSGLERLALQNKLTFAGDLQYPDIDNHHNNRYEDDYSQLPDEELCLKHACPR